MNHQLGCRPRTFHPTIDIVIPSLNSRSPPSQGYESTRMVPGCHSASQTSQHSSSHRFLNTQQSKVHQLSSLQPAQPKRMDPLLCHTVPQVVHLLPGLQCIYSRISMLGLSGFTVVNKI
jgi:hypothetical protein